MGRGRTRDLWPPIKVVELRNGDENSTAIPRDQNEREKMKRQIDCDMQLFKCDHNDSFTTVNCTVVVGRNRNQADGGSWMSSLHVAAVGSGTYLVWGSADLLKLCCGTCLVRGSLYTKNPGKQR